MKVFKSVLELRVRHNYYEDKVCTDLEFKPTIETSLFMKRHRLILKPKKDGFHIIRQYNETEGSLTPFIDITENFSLKFNIFFNNKVFFNYTNLSFYNSRITNLGIKHKIQAEHKEEQLIISDQNELPVYYRDLKIVDAAKSIRVKNSDMQTVLEVLPVPATEVINIDLGDISQGLYLLEVDEVHTMPFVHGEPYAVAPVGMFEVLMDIKDLIATDYKLDIIFEPREILWKYVIQKKFNELDKIQVIDERGEYEFAETETYEQEACIRKEFISDREIPLLEKNNLIFKVIRKTERVNNEKVIIEKLPFPDMHNINVDENKNGGKVFTPIFVLI